LDSKSFDKIIDNLLDHPAENSRLLIIEGPSGSGKTTWCMQLLERAKLRKVTVAGLLSPAVFMGNQKTGIELMNIQTGERRVLATQGKRREDSPARGPWSFDPEVLNWGNDVLRSIPPCQVVIIDEIGPLEFEQHIGLLTAFDLIDSRRDMLTCLSLRPYLVKRALERWQWAEVLSLPGNIPDKV
jgi:nucleoside-triphosphatase THEP1